jgi:hypothetical protein
MYRLELSKKMVMSFVRRAAYYFLNLVEAVFLSRLLVGSVLQLVVKCSARSVGCGTLGRSALSLCTLVFRRYLVLALFLRVFIRGVIRLTSGC